VDLARADAAVQKHLVDVFNRHGVMVVRGQTFTPLQQLEFTRRFGEPEGNPGDEFTYQGHNEIYVISNKIVDGQLIGNWDAGQGWHSDAAYRETPTMCTLLYAVEVPDEGSDTLFADLCAAYEALSDAERAEYDGFQVVHSLQALFQFQRAGRVRLPGVFTDEVVHPLIRTQPADGRKALWVSNGTATGIVGMEESTALSLIDRLIAFCTQERFVYAHRWRAGDLLIWDNRCTLHRGTPFDRDKYTRLVYRTWARGERPV
jgi:taurine dioxygenase